MTSLECHQIVINLIKGHSQRDVSFGEEVSFPSCTYKKNGPTINHYNNSFSRFILSSLLLYNTLSVLFSTERKEEVAEFSVQQRPTNKNSPRRWPKALIKNSNKKQKRVRLNH